MIWQHETYSVLPILAWMVDQGHAEDIFDIGVEDIKANGTTVVSQFGIEAGNVSEGNPNTRN